MLKFFLAALAVLVLVPSLLWGFPGAWVLLAIVPAFILAATFANLRRGKDEVGATPRQIRPGVLVLGGFFALASGSVAVMFMWASNAPSKIELGSARVVEAPIERIWELVRDPRVRMNWDQWILDAEAIGDPAEIGLGQELNTDLNMERLQRKAKQRVEHYDDDFRDRGYAIAWSIAPWGGGPVENMIERVSLWSVGDMHTLVHYELSYDINDTVSRLFERIAMRGGAQRMTAETLLKLERAVSQ